MELMRADAAQGAPLPTVELILWARTMRALMVVMGRKKAIRMLRLMAEGFATDEEITALLPGRPASQSAAVALTRHEAAETYMRYAPVFAAAIPPP